MSDKKKFTKKRRKIPLDIIIHVVCYLLVNTGLYFINQINTSYFWFLWSLIGWGIALLLHIFVRIIARTKLRGYTKALVLHWFLYLIMIGYFTFIDTFTGQDFSNPITWAYFPISAWFSILFAHTLSTMFILIRHPPEEQSSRKRYHLVNSFIVHLLVFLCANAYMLIINTILGYENRWHYWPLAGTALALSIHLFVTIIESVNVKNIQLKILLYHIFLFIVVSGYLIFENLFLESVVVWWYWPVGGWALGIILHLLYYFVVVAVKQKK